MICDCDDVNGIDIDDDDDDEDWILQSPVFVRACLKIFTHIYLTIIRHIGTN